MAEEGIRYKTFNTAGLCFPDRHYMVAPLPRLKKVEHLINENLYFTIHAPRQTGKTTYLHALAQKLNQEGKYIALVVSFERAGYNDIPMSVANETLIDSVFSAAGRQLPGNLQPENPNGKQDHHHGRSLTRQNVIYLSVVFYEIIFNSIN